jgi:hypothetical protein
MVVGQETKRKIIGLYFTQHKNIREIAKEVQKSSRDVVAMVKEHTQELQRSQPSMNAGDGAAQQIEEASIEPLVYVRAYELFTKGLTPLQVESELKISEEDTTRYYTEYLRIEAVTRLRLPFKATAGTRKN